MDLREKCRSILLKERAALEAALFVDEAARDTVELDQQTVGRLSRMDAMQSKAMADALFQRQQQRIREIDACLARMDAGEWGFCIDCEEPIEPARLEKSPGVMKCFDCMTS